MYRRLRLNSSGIEMASKLILVFVLLGANVTTTDAFAQQVSNSFAQTTRVENLSPQTLIKIIDRYRGKPYENFRRFVLDLYLTGKPMLSLEQHNAIGDFAANKRISPAEAFVVHRLLGVYTRLKYGGEARRMLAKLVSIPSVRQDGVEQHKNANFIQLEKTIAAYAKEFKLKYKNIGGRVYEVSLPGKGGVQIGLHAHGDVVPVNPDLWKLEDGTKLDPFKMTQVGNKLYGRGTQDDKNGIVASMIAMRIIKEENIRLFNSFKLLIDTTEETTSTAIPYYFQRHAKPLYNIALDGDYPVVIAEKGFGLLFARIPVRRSNGAGNQLVSVSGGLAVNQIPKASQAVIKTATPERLAARLNDLAGRFVDHHGGDFTVVATTQSDAVILNVSGVSAHSSDPGSGVNPVSRMFLFIHTLRKEGLVDENYVTLAANFISENIGLDYFATQFGINFTHPFMGPLTAAVTQVKQDDKVLEVVINFRIPVGKPLAEIESVVMTRVDQWNLNNGSVMGFEFDAGEAMYRDPDGRWLGVLLDIASENLALPKQFGSSSAGTSVHFLPNGIQFGLAMPNEKYTGHNANEFKTIDQFLLDLQIVTEAMMRIGLMRNLD
jgi:acetylornithine deacetylase/succinyl-diaminopimelate desuccinylase-like protein